MAKVLNKRTDHIPPDAIYVGRPSKWGNPFRIGKDGTREQVVEMYIEWILCRPHLLHEFHELKGHDLVCWCAPEACHADILLKLANAAEEEPNGR